MGVRFSVCGVFGVLFNHGGKAVSPELLERSAATMGHRGPDARATATGPGFGLAHTRLSFLDLDPRAHQPFFDPTGRYGLVFNGEIYNHRELQGSLQQRGVTFRTTSDTEVVLECLMAFGVDALPRFEGMFALGFIDTQTRELLLARDRFGMKPLLVHDDGAQVVFTSEAKALRPWVDLRLDELTLSAYLLGSGGPTKGATFYQGIRSLEPGTWLRVRSDGVRETGSFFALPQFLNSDLLSELKRAPQQEVVQRVEDALRHSVQRQLFADSKVGAFCSGGVDSSLVMAMAAQSTQDLAIFHANVKGRWSEFEAAAALARHLKLELASVDVVDQDFVDLIPEVMRHYESPFTYHPNCAPLLMVSRLARENGVKGLLSGEGSDEAFLGYPWLGRQRLVNGYYRLGRGVRKVVRSLPGVGKIAWPSDEGRAAKVLDLLSGGEQRRDRDEARGAIAALTVRPWPRTVWTLDWMGHHLRSLLHRNDSMGMAASIEARFPFLDSDLMRLAVNLPDRYKLRWSPTVFEKAHPFMRDKWVVRHIADRYIPKALSQRIKIGFWTTVFHRMDVDHQFFADGFAAEALRIPQKDLSRTLDALDPGLRVQLLHLECFGRICLRDEPLDAVRTRLRNHVKVRPE